jgi:hypothetical protein
MKKREAQQIVEEWERKHSKSDTSACLSDVPAPACVCGWDGKVDWKAKGQKCPNCGAALT